MRKLTDKQEAFCEYYLIDRNATQAAIRAGYSEKTAASIGSENLTKPNILEYLQKRKDELKMDADEAMMLLSLQARSSMADYIRTNEFGTFAIDFSEVTPAQLRAIKSVTITQTQHGSKFKFELYDSQSALKEIIKLHRLDSGQATDNVEHKHNFRFSDMSDDELDDLLEETDE
jgi:phage terminase small subunit